MLLYHYLAPALSVTLMLLPAVTATCLCDKDAEQVAKNFGTLFSNYSPGFANQTITPDYTDYTDSVAWLINNATTCPIPFGSATFTSRLQWEQGQETQPNIPYQQLNVFHDCKHVFIRWVSKLEPEQVQGISILETVINPSPAAFAKQPWLIKTVYSEFNSGAWGVNLGLCHGKSPVPNCPA